MLRSWTVPKTNCFWITLCFKCLDVFIQLNITAKLTNKYINKSNSFWLYEFLHLLIRLESHIQSRCLPVCNGDVFEQRQVYRHIQNSIWILILKSLYIFRFSELKELTCISEQHQQLSQYHHLYFLNSLLTQFWSVNWSPTAVLMFTALKMVCPSNDHLPFLPHLTFFLIHSEGEQTVLVLSEHSDTHTSFFFMQTA